jgi:hypothetical protein
MTVRPIMTQQVKMAAIPKTLAQCVIESVVGRIKNQKKVQPARRVSAHYKRRRALRHLFSPVLFALKSDRRWRFGRRIVKIKSRGTGRSIAPE